MEARLRRPVHLDLKAIALLCLLPVTAFALLFAGVTFAAGRPSSGEWVFVPSPNPDTSSVFRAVSALAPDDVWAVGQSSGSALATLTAHWDGTQWTRIPSPNSGSINSTLMGVAAVAPNDVWAVGYYVVAGGNPQTLIEHWDGSSWSIVPSPYIQGGTALNAIAVVSANDIWAVGYRVVGAPGPTVGTLTVHWNGSSWQIVDSPNVASRSHDLTSVVAISSNDVWAVGYSRNVGGNYHSLALHWDGSSWNVVSTPTGPQGSELFAVDGVSANDIWATGIQYDGGGTQPFFLHWTGSNWNVVPSPGGGSGLAAISSNDVWAVGGTFAHWDGTEWSLVPGAPVPGGSDISPRAVSALSGTDVWAVGRYNNGSQYVTLTEHWQEAGPVTPTPVPPATNTPGIPTNTPTPPNATATTTATGTPPNATVTATPPNATATGTAVATPTATACSIAFSDVLPGSPFYAYVQCLACRDIVTGYSDGTFRPNNDITRGQAAKIVANAAGYNEPIPPTQQTFTDVPPDSLFWVYIERVALHGAIGGYSDGTYRPFNNMTRGQLAKVTAQVEGYGDPIPTTQQTFTDVPPDSLFWVYIERVALHGVVTGYSDGTYRPFNNVTRGQTSKIVSNTFFPECDSQGSYRR